MAICALILSFNYKDYIVTGHQTPITAINALAHKRAKHGRKEQTSSIIQIIKVIYIYKLRSFHSEKINKFLYIIITCIVKLTISSFNSHR